MANPNRPNPPAVEPVSPPAGAPVEAASNPFAKAFGRVEFKDLAKIEPMPPFQDGTVQTRITEVAIEIGNSGAFLTGIHVVKREKGDIIAVQLQFPTGKTRFQKLLRFDSPVSQTAFDQWEETVVSKWAEYRKARVASGEKQTVSRSSHTIDRAKLSELGL